MANLLGRLLDPKQPSTIYGARWGSQRLGRAIYIGVQPPGYGSAPTITNVVPTPGVQLRGKRAVQFDVLDDTGLAFCAVYCRQGTRYDVVHDGLNPGPYGVTISIIPGGKRYVVVPLEDWSPLRPPRFVVRALDFGGQLG